jgi:hypothetical protein
MASAETSAIRFVVLSMLALSTSAASAAVRQCWPIVSSEIASAPTELDAKKKALAQWRAKAQALGPGLDSWRLAHDKSLKCFPKAPGSFECIAFGAPCVIDQTPKSPPPGKGVGI